MSVGDALGSNASENKLVKAHMAWRHTEKKGTGRQERGKKIFSRKPVWALYL